MGLWLVSVDRISPMPYHSDSIEISWSSKRIKLANIVSPCSISSNFAATIAYTQWQNLNVLSLADVMSYVQETCTVVNTSRLSSIFLALFNWSWWLRKHSSIVTLPWWASRFWPRRLLPYSRQRTTHSSPSWKCMIMTQISISFANLGLLVLFYWTWWRRKYPFTFAWCF